MKAPARRLKSCQHCGNGFKAKTPTQKYCGDECAYGAAMRKNNGRNVLRRIHERNINDASMQHITQAKPVVLRRARSLADTPDVPAQGIDRGEQLTGACSATVQADNPCR